MTTADRRSHDPFAPPVPRQPGIAQEDLGAVEVFRVPSNGGLDDMRKEDLITLCGKFDPPIPTYGTKADILIRIKDRKNLE